MKNVASVSVNKECCSHQATMAPLKVSPEGTQKGDKCASCRQALSLCSLTLPPVGCLGELRMEKNEVLALDSSIAEMHIKRTISGSPDSCIFPYIKSAIFMKLGCLVFFISQECFDVLTTWPLLQNPRNILAPSLPFWSSPLELF